MKHYDICCVGHITLDKIVTPRLTVHSPGGTAYYFAHAMRSLHAGSFLLVTKMGDSERHAADNLAAQGIEVKAHHSASSVYFENKYGDNQNNRRQRVLAKADPFTADDIRDIDARYFHLGSLLADDFSLDIIRALSGKGTVSVDAQGYLREVRGDKVFATDWPDKLEALRYIDILKVNEHEAMVLTGEADPTAAATELAGWGVKEVVLTLGSEGSMIFAGGALHCIPAYPPHEVVDATGCGDTYMAGYLYRRSLGDSIDDAARFAAAMCTIKLEATGPFTATAEEVKSRIHQF